MQPYNYTIQRPDLAGALQKGLAIGADIGQTMNLNKYKESLKFAMAGENKANELSNLVQQYPEYAQTTNQLLNGLKGEEYKKDLQVALNENTPESLSNLVKKYPEQIDKFKPAFDTLNENQKSNELKSTGEVYAALINGDKDTALKLVDTRINALKNVGGDTSKLESTKQYIETNPEVAKGMIGLTLSSLMGADNFKKTFEALGGKEQYNVLTAAEKSKLGLPINGTFQISPEGKITEVGGSKTVVNVGGGKSGPQFGSIPAGFMLTQTADGYAMVPVAGSPADIEAKTIAEKKAKSTQATATTGNIVLEDLDRLKKKIKSNPLITGSLERKVIPDWAVQDRIDADNLKETILANIGFDKLQAIKESSPTGGALGAVSDRELSNLQAVMGNLNMSQGEEQILKNIDRINVIYKGIIKKANAYPNASQFGFGTEQKSNSSLDDIMNKYK